MSEKRRDNRGRILHTGEVQLSTGQYRYKYVDNYEFGDSKKAVIFKLKDGVNFGLVEPE